jgi:hypothetical protein
MFVRHAFLVLAVLMVQLISTQTRAQIEQKSLADSEKNKGARAQYTQDCGTRKHPAPYGTHCGYPKELHICNGKNTICCTIGDNDCLSGQ